MVLARRTLNALLIGIALLLTTAAHATDIDDPLTDGTTVGSQHGGTFTSEGWKTTGPWDYIQYKVSTIASGYVEFDVRGWYADQAMFSYSHKTHFFGMYDDSYDDRNGDHIKTNSYKCFMRIYGYEPGYTKWGILKLRLNVAAYYSGEEDDPNAFEAYARVGGQTTNDSYATHWDWQEDEWYHFRLEWGGGHMVWYKDSEMITDYDYTDTGEEYAPPDHIIRIGHAGVYETPIGEIFRNVRIVDATVPVEMHSFQAITGYQVILRWQTASETTNQGFEVQRGSDGVHFEAIGFIRGNGTTSAARKYQFKDRPEEAGTYWYRLRQIDVDGTSVMIEPVKVVWAPEKVALLASYPNPFNARTVVTLVLPVRGNAHLEIFDLAGRQVANLHKGELEAGSHSWTWKARDERGRELATGVYFIRLNLAEARVTRRVLLLR